MPTVNTVPGDGAQRARITARLEDLERATAVASSSSVVDKVVFNADGFIAVGDSGFDVFATGGHLVLVIAMLKVAGTTDTVVDVSVNETSIGTVTVPAGERYVTAYLGDHFIAALTDLVEVAVTTAGAGAQKLTVALIARLQS